MKLRKIAIMMLSLPLFAAVTACQKEYPEDEVIEFIKGWYEWRELHGVDIKGETIVLDNGYLPLVVATPSTNASGQVIWEAYHWEFELDWVNVTYTPDTKTLYIPTRTNNTGHERTAVMTAEGPKGRVVYRIIQY